MYRIRILNHRVIGHAYIPICKFQILSVVNGREVSQQSQYINPPLSGMQMNLNNANVKNQQTTNPTNNNPPNSYTKQFPLTFDSLRIQQNNHIQIKLIQLTKNGRQKQIGYSRLILNHEVLNKVTKHKIMKNQTTLTTTTGQVISIVDIHVELVKMSVQSLSSVQNGNTKAIMNQPIKNKQLPQSYTLQEQSQQQQQQQQNYQDDDSQLDENAKFQYNDQSGYLDDNNNDQAFNDMLNGNKNDISHHGMRNQYILNGKGNKNSSHKELANQNSFNQSVMDTRYGGRVRTEVSSRNQQKYISPRDKQYMRQEQQHRQQMTRSKILSAGKIYKQQQFNKSNNNNYNNNTNKSYQQRKQIIGQRLNESSQGEYDDGIRQQMNNNVNTNNSNNSNKQSRRYLVQQRREELYQSTTMHDDSGDRRIKSFSGNDNISNNINHLLASQTKVKNNQKDSNNNNINNNPNNNNTTKTKRRLKYIFSNNQLRYLTNNSIANDDDSILGRRDDGNQRHYGHKQQSQKNIKKVFSKDNEMNRNSTNEKVLMRSPIVGNLNERSQANRNSTSFHEEQKKPKQSNNNNIMIKTPSLTPTRQHPSPILQAQLPLQNQPPLQYFITQHETNPQVCYILKNVHVVYQVSPKDNMNKKNSKQLKQQFRPRFITFLTYNLYEKVVRVNCLSNELGGQNVVVKGNHYSSNKVKYLDAKESSNFILKSPQGEVKPSAVCDTFAHLQLLLPKYCLIFRVQIIMQDESIFIGTLANQLGSNIKSTLHLKKTLHSQNNTNSTKQLNSSFESINLVVDICDLNSNQKRQEDENDFGTKNNEKLIESLQKPNKKGGSQNRNIFDNNSRSHTLEIETKQTPNRHGPSIEKSLSSISPLRRKQIKQSAIQYLPNINLIDGQFSGNQSDGKLMVLNDFIKNNNGIKREQSPIQKTLNAITAYKICLSSMTGPIYEPNKDQVNKNSLHYSTGQNYHINFNSFDKNGQKSPQYHREKQKINHILLQQQENNQSNNNDLNNSADDSDLQYLMRRGISDIRMKQTLSKDLPKIIIQRSNMKPLNYKKQAFKSVKEEFSSMINKRNKSTSQDQFSYKNQVRLEFFKKILGNRYVPNQHKNSSIQSLKNNKNSSKRSHSKSKIFLNEKRNEMASKKYKKLSTLPYCDLNSTKVFSSDAKSKYQKHSKLSVSPHKQTKKHTYARQLKCLKDHCMSNSSLLNLLTQKQPQQTQQKNLSTYRVSIRKIDFLKLLDNKQKQHSKKQKQYGSDNEQSDIQLNRNQSQIENSQHYQVFIKLFNESKKKKKQFITTTQGLKPTFGQKTAQNQHNKSKRKDQKSPQELDHLSCSWILQRGQFLFKKIKLDDLITVEAYGDLASVDNHEFLGKCIFSVQQMLYMKYQKKITGYMVKKKTIESHVTVHFEIEENIN